MTLESVIAYIYESYKCEPLDCIHEEKLMNEIQCAIVTNWSAIELFNEIQIYNKGSSDVSITISEDLRREFEEKYPEALL